jgi:hypothetical protein
MKTLIITVGTRQVGWKCKDGIVRSLGADGTRNDPKHIEEIYRYELGIKRGYHQDEGSDRIYPWSVWDLGQRLYQRCQQTDFSHVELLLDQVIITEQVNQGLSHILLWGTQQPDTVTWNYRRMDTAWLAELMAGKLRETYSDLEVEVFKPIIEAVDTNAIRDELEMRILPFALQTRLPEDEQFTIIIENKGATPAISEGLNICAGALVRDCQVVTMTPIEPRLLYPNITETAQAVALATEYRSVNLSSYFWPLERSRILSAWQRGDFAEAAIWLAAHRDQHKPLYELATYLVLTNNWQMDQAIKGIKNWLGTKAAKKRISTEQQQIWQTLINQMCPPKDQQTPQSKYLKIWETRFLIHLSLSRENYTLAFVQFVQTLERLLFWRYETEDWIAAGWITPPEDKKAYGLKYKATLGELKTGWLKLQNLDSNHPIAIKLDAINELRNSVIHRSTALTPVELSQQIWTDMTAISPEQLYELMVETLQTLLPPDRPMPDRSLLQDLYQWGMEQLQA